jgi:copper chaperone CopZ
MNEKWLAVGSAGTAFIASLCCLGPLVLGGLGLGALLVATFAPLRPYFLTASGILLVLGFYFVYRTPRAAAACEGEVCAPDNPARRLAKPVLWLATLAVLALALFPYYGGKLVPATRAAAPRAAAALETIELQIAGMDCEACAGVIRNKLLETPGVAAAEVHYPAGHAVVRYDAARVEPEALLAAVASAGYSATLAEER